VWGRCNFTPHLTIPVFMKTLVHLLSNLISPLSIFMPNIGSGFDDDDNLSATSTVASTVGTGLLSLASRMSALNVDFGDKLHAEEGHTIEEEDEEGDGSRSDRTDRTQRTMNTMNTAQTEDREERDSVLEDTFSR